MHRSVMAVVAGIATLIVTSFAIEAGVNPWLETIMGSGAVRAVTYGYSLVCVALGGWVAARLAPRAPGKHALAMGVAQAALTIVAMFSPEGHHATPAQWILIAVLSIPAAWTGGLLRTARE